MTTPVIGNSVMAGSARYHGGTGGSHSVGGSQHVSVLRQDQSEHVCGTKTFSQASTNSSFVQAQGYDKLQEVGYSGVGSVSCASW